MHLDNKRHSVYGKSKEICWDKRTKMLINSTSPAHLAVNTSKSPKAQNANQTYGELLTAYFERKKARKPPLSKSAIDNIDRCIRLHINEKVKNTIISKLQPSMLEDNLYKIVSSRMREYTYTVFTGSLRYAFSNGLINKELWRLIEHEKHKPESCRPLEDEEYDMIISKADNELKRYIVGYCWTGCRRNELLSIRYKDVGERINIFDQKTNKWKQVPKFPPLEEVLGEGLPDAKVFPRNSHWVNKKLRELCDSIGLNDISPHNLRNTFGSVLYDAGVDMKDIQTWLGHSTLKVTQDIYTKRRTKTVNKAINDVTLLAKKSLC